MAMESEIIAHVNGIMSNLPASSQMINRIVKETDKDSILTEVCEYIKEGWPFAKNQYSRIVTPYWEHHSNLTILKGLIMLGDRIVIPKDLQADILQKIRAGHCSIEKCKRNARQNVFCPGMNRDIETTVKRCKVYIELLPSKSADPLLHDEVPNETLAEDWE